MSIQARLAHVAALFSALVAPSALAQLPAADFKPIPGERELSGRLIARPIQAEEAGDRGVSPAAAMARAADARRMLRAVGIEREFPEVDEFVINVPFGESEESVAARLMASGNFSYVEPDWIVFPVGCPNDVGFAQQWHHAANRLDSCSAWDFNTGSADVVVAICDTGILATHQDLLLNRRQGFHVPSQTWEGMGGPIGDVNGHGTNTTGSAAGNGNNGIGIAGVGWNLGHRMMRVTDSADGSAALSNLTLAARVAADSGDKVASVSYSGVNSSSSVFTTGTYVRSKGALLVWAAGNSGANLSGNREDSVIVVGATDQNDVRASFSNYGSLVDVFAPGVSILTTSSAGNASYESVSGTSFACPITAGLCAMIWSRNPSLTPAEVESILRNSCTDLGIVGIDTTYGYGRIDSAVALAMTPPYSDTTPPAAPIGLAATAANASVSLAWSASTEADLAGYRVYRSADGGASYAEVSTALVTSPAFTDGSVSNGVTYRYVVRAQDASGNLSAASAWVSATPQAPGQPTQLFFDGFESGNLSAGGWRVQNTDSFASMLARVDGAWGARVVRKSWMERAVSTAGHANIQLSYVRRTAGLESNEFLAVEWWDGVSWRALESTRDTVFAARTWSLPASAAGNPWFKVRFRVSANRTDEWGDVDGVTVIGTPTG